MSDITGVVSAEDLLKAADVAFADAKRRNKFDDFWHNVLNARGKRLRLAGERMRTGIPFSSLHFYGDDLGWVADHPPEDERHPEAWHERFTAADAAYRRILAHR